jgi:hypothetical protein
MTSGGMVLPRPPRFAPGLLRGRKSASSIPQNQTLVRNAGLRYNAAMVSDSTLFLFIAVLFLAMLLIGLPGVAIDIVMIFVLLLTGAALFIALFARKLSDIKGFCILAGGIALLRMGGNVAAVKAILLSGGAGRVVNWCGTTMYGGMMSIIVYSAAALIAIVFILGGWRFVFRRAAESLRQVRPFDTVSSETGCRETFFRSMTIVAKLSVCEAIIAFMAACVTLAGAMARINEAAGAIGASCLTVVSAILTVGGSLILINKQFLIAQDAQESETSDLRTAAIYVKSREIHRNDTHTSGTSQNKNKSMDRYYDTIFSAVQHTHASVILLAGERIADLPVTVAVHTAVRFAYRNKRTLLVDTDASRNAVAQAFEVDIAAAHKKPAVTCIENLWISSAQPFLESDMHFEQVIIYSPNAASADYMHQFADMKGAAVFFGKAAGLGGFAETLKKSGCHIIFETALSDRP